MRVRISYGIDVKEIPEELKKLFFSVSDEAHKTSKKLHRIEEFLSDAVKDLEIHFSDNPHKI